MKRFLSLVCLLFLFVAVAYSQGYTIKGRVIDRLSRQPIEYANVLVVGGNNNGVGAATDMDGNFVIEKVKPGICKLSVSYLGYKSVVTPDYIISATTPFIEIEMDEDSNTLEGVVVRPNKFNKTIESPVSMKVIGLREIEKSPGANRDISRIVRSYPGVSFSPVGYRNDLIVRGGGPSENRFYMDGIEIPNINHFATQGATGGPVSIVNADLIREIKFYTGAFPANRSGALSSVLDFSLQDGNPDKQTFKATVGASELSLSGSGHFGKKTTYLFSVRQSYLQFLFDVLGLPFLPNYIDTQVKVKTRFSDTDELTFLALTGIDKMKLNTDEDSETAQYILSYLPTIEQETFTVGATYRHYAGKHVQTFTLSHNYLNNKNIKYRNNDESSEDNLTLRLRSLEQKTSFRAENRSYLGNWTMREGVELNYSSYTNNTWQRLFTDVPVISDYNTDLGLFSWGLFALADYTSPDKKLTASAGLRADAANYAAQTKRVWEQLSPRVSISYALNEMWSISGGSGIYYQLPPYTALGFKNSEGVWVNKGLDYMRVIGANLGFDWRWRDRWIVSVEGFYKGYGDVPLSIRDQVPLTCKGNDYGTSGDEALVSSAEGRAYGLETMVQWEIPNKLNLTGSFTLFKSEYRNNSSSPYIASAWDNRFVLNLSGTYDLPKHWSIGAKLSSIGGSPYTPYDIEKSSLVEAWDAQGRPYYDYDAYNTGRLDAFAQLDLRVDKDFYFKKWRFGVYLDLQNITGSKLKQPDALMSTGVIENPTAPLSEQRYVMKTVKQESGTILPTIGLTVEF
ncbi:MAG: carboxypeptidase-like regulatory domain-containing protein [Parabacteroides sp.]|nr:carboxypeptidase-like regulatory domain-containing protein [Parabacteroides sp.]